MTTDVVIIGAGIAGLAAARWLEAAGRTVRVLEKSRGVGGRMASRRVGDARFDHGAQFFTVRSREFADVVDRAKAAGAVTEWTHGFGDPPDGHPRWRGVDGMTALCKWLAADAGIAVEIGTTVVDLRLHPGDGYLLTAPVPQSLAMLSFSGLLPAPSVVRELAEIHYKPTLAVLATLDRDPTGLPSHGGAQVDGDALAFVADNRAKGISAEPSATIHLASSRSEELWEEPDEDVIADAARWAAPYLGSAAIVAAQVQRWRYAGPVEVHPEPTVAWGSAPAVALAGEAFAGPKVEGAFRSGLAAAERLHRLLG